jgi:Glyoxalase-like domain
MTLRLRQICLVAPHLEPSVSTICTVLGTMVSYVDPNVEKYGLINALMPFGNSFLEVVAPVEDGTAAGRYLDRRSGEGGYMVILDCDAIEPWLAHLPAVGVRVANDLDYPGEYRGLQLHPRDTGGALLEINCSHDGAWDGPYHPAGPRWKGAHGVDAEDQIVAAELQSPDPGRLAARWSEILRRPVCDAGGVAAIELDVGALRFVPATDGRGEGLGGIDVKIPRHERARFAARQKEVAEEDGALMLCGTRVRLV